MSEIKRYASEQFVLDNLNSGTGSSIELDETLTQSGKAADAKAVGDSLKQLNNILIQAEEPKDAAINTLWIDLSENTAPIYTALTNAEGNDY